MGLQVCDVIEDFDVFWDLYVTRSVFDAHRDTSAHLGTVLTETRTNIGYSTVSGTPNTCEEREREFGGFSDADTCPSGPHGLQQGALTLLDRRNHGLFALFRAHGEGLAGLLVVANLQPQVDELLERRAESENKIEWSGVHSDQKTPMAHEVLFWVVFVHVERGNGEPDELRTGF